MIDLPSCFTVANGGSCWIVRCRCGAGWLPRKEGFDDRAMCTHARKHKEVRMSTSTAQFQSTRISRRIDYSSGRVMARRRVEKLEQRARARSGTWVVGRFLADGDAIAFEAVAMAPTYNVDPEGLTRSVSRFYRWCTRQAAHQWLRRNPDARCAPVNLRELKGRQ